MYGQETIKLVRTTSPIIIDGIPNEAAWAEFEPFPMVQYEPVFKGALSEKQ